MPDITTDAEPARWADLPAACDRPAENGLEISATGAPERPLIIVELDGLRDAAPSTLARAAAAAHHALPLVVGVLRRPPTAALYPVLAATTLTLTELPVERSLPQMVSVDDVETGLEQLRTAVDRSPRAAVSCGHLLRQTVQMDSTRALAAEAAVYSMLLGGPEFRRWLAERGPADQPTRPDRALIQLERTGHRLSIRLDHPERRNALSAALREELLAAMHVAEADADLTDIEITGAGSIFCSGGDLDEFGLATDPVAAYLVRLDRAPWRAMDRLAGRLTTRVHGAAIGAGIEMAAFAGTVVATRDTYFQLPEVHMGLVPGAGGTLSIPRRIGRWRSAWLMLTGQRLPAPTALRWGLVDRLVDDRRG